MNFYIGNSIDEIDEQDVNVEFSDELLGFIYEMNERVPFELSKLYTINPYDDVEVSKEDLSQIAEICKYILDSTLLQDYGEPDEGKQMVQDLLELIPKAMSRPRDGEPSLTLVNGDEPTLMKKLYNFI